jgi:hypothetical protein
MRGNSFEESLLIPLILAFSLKGEGIPIPADNNQRVLP